MYNLPIIDYFTNGPQTVHTAFNKNFVNGQMTYTLSSPVLVHNYVELAELAIKYADYVKQFVDGYLTPQVMKSWRNLMGERVPPALNKYQKGKHTNRHRVLEDADLAINNIGATLSAGQKLYRGGTTYSGKQTRILSTTFSPSVAIHLASWGGRARRQGCLRLYVLEVINPQTHVYVIPATWNHTCCRERSGFCFGCDGGPLQCG